MMAIKFNKFERIAGLFILIAIVGSLLTAASVAIKQGWFEKKIRYYTYFENADGVHPGTVVQMAGLRAGSVEDVELQSDNRIRVSFYIHGKFQSRVRENSLAQLIRPFIIGDRVLEVTVGSEESQVLAENHQINSQETLDIMSIMSGKKMGNYLGRLGQLLDNLQEVLLAFSDRDRTTSLVRTFDRIDPLVSNLNTMSLEVIKLSRQATQEDNMKKVLANTAMLTKELNEILPIMNQENPTMAKDMAQMMKNLSKLTEDFKVLGPALTAVGTDLPDTAKRAVEALNEATVLIKAMQKSFFVRGSVQEVREQEAKESRRAPSSANKPSSSPVQSCEPVK